MNVQETTGIRELTVQELDYVTGGLDAYGAAGAYAVGGPVGLVLACAIDSIVTWLRSD